MTLPHILVTQQKHSTTTNRSSGVHATAGPKVGLAAIVVEMTFACGSLSCPSVDLALARRLISGSPNAFVQHGQVAGARKSRFSTAPSSRCALTM
jgi:hypothetical protein